MRSITYVSALAIIALIALVFGASRWVSQAPPSPAGPQVKAPVSKTLSASALDARIAVARVFGDAVFLNDVSNPTFISADWNGDGSEDLAIVVIVNPNRTVAGNELQNWSVTDVRNVELPSAATSVYTFHKKPRPITLRNNQVLIAVIHGAGELGWRSPESSQSYLLVNTPVRKLSQAEIVDLNQRGVLLPRTTSYPTHALIAESANEAMAVYWSGAQYAASPINRKTEIAAMRE